MEESYDVFLAAPMASYASDDAYRRDRENVLRIIHALHQAGYTVSYAGQSISSMADFDAGDTSIGDDYRALRASRYFVLWYPEKLASSVLVEAGWALALDKPSVYFVRNRADLPFLLRHADGAFPSVQIYGQDGVEAVVRLIAEQGTDLFTTPAGAAG
jgi:hypothetical protein